jgi:hypothetical protein
MIHHPHREKTMADWEEATKRLKNQFASMDGDTEIDKDDYLRMLEAFQNLVRKAKDIPESFDTDFRRNLPGGGMRGIEGRYEDLVPPLTERIEDAIQYARVRPIYPLAGEMLVENIRAILKFVSAEVITNALMPMQAIAT